MTTPIYPKETYRTIERLRECIGCNVLEIKHTGKKSLELIALWFKPGETKKYSKSFPDSILLYPNADVTLERFAQEAREAGKK